MQWLFAVELFIDLEITQSALLVQQNADNTKKIKFTLVLHFKSVFYRFSDNHKVAMIKTKLVLKCNRS